MGGRVIKCNPVAPGYNPRADKVSAIEKALMGPNGKGNERNGTGAPRQNGSVHIRLGGEKTLLVEPAAHKEMHDGLVAYINECRVKLGIDAPLPTDAKPWEHEGKAEGATRRAKAALAALAELAKCVQGCDYENAIRLKGELESLLSQAGEKAEKGIILTSKEVETLQPGF